MKLPSERNPPAASCGISERIKQDARDLTFENSCRWVQGASIWIPGVSFFMLKS